MNTRSRRRGLERVLKIHFFQAVDIIGYILFETDLKDFLDQRFHSSSIPSLL